MAKLVTLYWFRLLTTLGKTLGEVVNGGLLLDHLGFEVTLQIHLGWLLTGLSAVCLQSFCVKELQYKKA